MSGGTSRKIVVGPITMSFFRGRRERDIEAVRVEEEASLSKHELGIRGGRGDDDQVSLASLGPLDGVDRAGF
jgi:hypothetical protein